MNLGPPLTAENVWFWFDIYLWFITHGWYGIDLRLFPKYLVVPFLRSFRSKRFGFGIRNQNQGSILVLVLESIFDRLTCSKRSKESLFSAKKNVLFHLLNFSVFHHVFISSLDMFKNRINSYHIESKQVGTCLDVFENHKNYYHIESEQVQTCLRIITIHIILIMNMFRHVLESYK